MILNRFRASPIPSLLVALTALAAITDASANTACGTRSPTLERLGADYLSLEPDVDPVIRESETLEELIADRSDPRRAGALRLAHVLETLQTASLDGIEGERTRCRGTGAAIREVRWRFDLEQLERVTMLNGRTALTAFEARHALSVDEHGHAFGDDRLVDGTRVAEVMTMPPADAWRPSADGKSLRFSHRFRRAGAATTSCTAATPTAGVTRCSLLAEIDTTARVAGHRAIELEQVLYIDGRLSERALWRLGS